MREGATAPRLEQRGDALFALPSSWRRRPAAAGAREQHALINEGGCANPTAHLLPGLDGVECCSPGLGDGGGMLPSGLVWSNGGPVYHWIVSDGTALAARSIGKLARN
ncbi:unnamed protein product [Urochloa humidicola]